MTKETVSVGIANEGELNLDIDVVKAWVPKEVNAFGDTVFFRNDTTFVSMKRTDFVKFFEIK